MIPARFRDDYDPPEVDRPQLTRDDHYYPSYVELTPPKSWCSHCWSPLDPDGYCAACNTYITRRTR